MILTVDDPDAVEFTILTSRCGLVVLIKETAKTISRRTAVAAAVATCAADSSLLARGARTTWMLGLEPGRGPAGHTKTAGHPTPA
jgi:hypothetical protein